MLQSGQDNFMIDIQMKGKISKIDLYLYWQLVQYNFSEVLEEETWTEYTGTNKSLTNLTKIMRETYLFNLLWIWTTF